MEHDNQDERPEDAPDEKSAEGHPFYPGHVINDAIIFCLLFGVVITLGILRPFHLHEPADPMYTPPGIKPEWYFLAMYQGIKYVPKIVGVAGTGIVIALVLLWPFIAAPLEKLAGGRPIHTWVGIVGLVGWLVLSGLGYICERNVTIGGKEYHITSLGYPKPVDGDHAPASGPTDHE